ncbi:hypothetical protein Q0N58_15510, partial [Staphylococcus aureus]|nr:hypothetical protein [Staphylococcus aureus]
ASVIGSNRHSAAISVYEEIRAERLLIERHPCSSQWDCSEDWEPRMISMPRRGAGAPAGAAGVGAMASWLKRYNWRL